MPLAWRIAFGNDRSTEHFDFTDKETEAEKLCDWVVPFGKLLAEPSLGLCRAPVVQPVPASSTCPTWTGPLPPAVSAPVALFTSCPHWFWREGGDAAKEHDDSTHGLASVLFLSMWLLYI